VCVILREKRLYAHRFYLAETVIKIWIAAGGGDAKHSFAKTGETGEPGRREAGKKEKSISNTSGKEHAPKQDSDPQPASQRRV